MLSEKNPKLPKNFFNKGNPACLQSGFPRKILNPKNFGEAPVGMAKTTMSRKLMMMKRRKQAPAKDKKAWTKEVS